MAYYGILYSEMKNVATTHIIGRLLLRPLTPGGIVPHQGGVEKDMIAIAAASVVKYW